jgi:CRISPR-associated endonuclease/helicase Cas3
MEVLAHSAKPDKNIPSQSYSEHISNTLDKAMEYARQVGEFNPELAETLELAVTFAAEYHDMGKLDIENQDILSGKKKAKKLPVNHVDAGVAHLIQLSSDSLPLFYAAIISYAHHIGLQSHNKEEEEKETEIYRDLKLFDHTNAQLNYYLKQHQSVINKQHLKKEAPLPKLEQLPLFLRFSLSCLVNADHGDTARHYGEMPTPSYSLKAEERLKLLDSYVANLAKEKPEEQRTKLRNSVYDSCKNASTKPALYACDSPVGSGKTTAVMAHLLNVAKEKELQRIFVVVPFTNIIDQSVETYRKALILEGENPENIISAHHHKADFSSPETRQYTYLWQAPIVVVTAVQFFETLSSNRPSPLRKLHQLAGSAIFIDEAHAALPSHLWVQAWQWLKQLTDDWGCHIVLGSGSLSRFWELPDFVKPPVKLPELINDDIREQSAELEQARIKYLAYKEKLNLTELVEWVFSKSGTRLLIVNTVQSAAVIAQYIAENYAREKVEHLSTALTPIDRHKTLTKVKARLKNKQDNDWVLVATSCVEAGVDLSFNNGFRERCSLVSLLQTSGRVNRENEINEAEIWDFSLKFEGRLKEHPAFNDSIRVLGELFDKNKVSPDFCCEALKNEIRQEGSCSKGLIEKIEIAESNLDFPEVEKLFKVISNNTLTVLVNDDVIERLKNREQVSRNDIQKNSVEIWHYKKEDWGLTELTHYAGLFYGLDYDSFIGYMKGGLSAEKTKEGGVLMI